MHAEPDQIDLLVQQAQLHIERSLKLPLDGRKRKAIVRKYVLLRAGGYGHTEAKRMTLASYSSAWLLIASIALQVLFYLLKKWWERRDD